MDRQRLHLKAPDHWVNDPNGFIYYRGYYHVFYQYFPYGTRWGTMHWGHAVSKDLVHWEHRGVALFPTKRSDQNGCFSGSAVEKDGRLHLIYTGVRYEETDPEDIHVSPEEAFISAQMMITSEDGFRFDNWKDKEVLIPPITDPGIGDRAHTRDPKVWRGSDAWYMVLGTTADRTCGRILFYRSEDLHRWTYVNQVSREGFGWMWECPDYMRVDGGELLLLSAMGIPQNGETQQNHTVCFPVELQEESCTMTFQDGWQFLDYGLDLYAPQTTVDEDGRRIMIAWARMPKPDGEGWIGMFCAPRVVEMRHGHVYFRMHPGIRAAYSCRIADPGQAVPDGYRAVLTLKEGEEADVGGLLIRRENGRIRADRTGVYPSDEGLHLVSETPVIREGDRLEILADQNLVEIYINDGEYVLSNIVYGLKPYFACSAAGGAEFYTLADQEAEEIRK